MQEAIILEIIKQLLTYGPEIVTKIADILNGKNDVTVEDIRSCVITKPPENYFKPNSMPGPTPSGIVDPDPKGDCP